MAEEIISSDMFHLHCLHFKYAYVLLGACLVRFIVSPECEVK